MLSDFSLMLGWGGCAVLFDTSGFFLQGKTAAVCDETKFVVGKQGGTSIVTTVEDLGAKLDLPCILYGIWTVPPLP